MNEFDPKRAAHQKRAVAEAALAWVEPQLQRELIIGIGTGSTADHFIDLLGPLHARFAGAVASSGRSAERLQALGIRVFDLDDVGELPFYIDGADEINSKLEMTKGGGGALTREKIVAAASTTFVCIVDASKRVTALGRFPLPIEVIPMARSHVVRSLERLAVELGLGAPTMRVRIGADGQPFITDNGNRIIDVAGWTIADPVALETRIGAIVGVVESGLFALRPADMLMVAEGDEVRTVLHAP
jgi:ribose 5-phosphate isomerase A